MLGGATAQTYADALRLLLARPARRCSYHALRTDRRRRSRDDVARAIDDVAATEADGKPLLAVLHGRRRACRKRSVRAKAMSPRSRIPSLPPGRWARRRACRLAAPAARGRSHARRRRPAGRLARRRTAISSAVRTSGSSPPRRASSFRRTDSPRRRADADDAASAVEAARELGLPGRREVRRGPALTRPTPGASHSILPTTMRYARPSRPSVHPSSCSRWCAAVPSSSSASSRIPCSAPSWQSGRRRARRAHRRGRHPDRAAHGTGSRGARPERQGRTARSRVPRRAGGGRRSDHRSRPSPRPPRGGAAGRGRARPESGHRSARPLRRGRCAVRVRHPSRSTGRRPGRRQLRVLHDRNGRGTDEHRDQRARSGGTRRRRIR